MISESTTAQLEVKYEATLGEGPVWDEENEQLWWLDILSKKVFCYSPAGNSNRVFEADEFTSALALREKGGLVVAKRSGFAFFEPEEERWTPIANPEAHLPGNRFNDGKCDPAGRFWAGTMRHDQTGGEGKGNLYRLNPDLQVEKVLDNLTIPNGLAWNFHAKKFYHIDSPTRQIRSFNYNPDDGSLADPVVIKTIEKGNGYPDGMTIDRDGYLWVALYAGGRVIRVHPESGETDFEVALPVPKPTSCTFGGSNLDELYITTCREFMSEEELAQAPLSGSLFKAVVPFRGSPPDRFSG